MITNIKTFNQGAGMYVVAEGKLDLETAVPFGTKIKDNLDDVTELILDFSKISYVSSIGLRVILELHQQMQTQGSMRIVNVQDSIMQIFKMTGFIKFLNIN